MAFVKAAVLKNQDPSAGHLYFTVRAHIIDIQLVQLLKDLRAGMPSGTIQVSIPMDTVLMGMPIGTIQVRMQANKHSQECQQTQTRSA